MKNIPLDHYPPLARKAILFLNAAKKTYEIVNRTDGFEEVSYYLLSHAIELSIKAVVQKKTGQFPERIHDKEELATKYSLECSFLADEINAIRKLKDLNDGPGGLRYDNHPKGKFLPSIFKKNVKIVEKLMKLIE